MNYVSRIITQILLAAVFCSTAAATGKLDYTPLLKQLRTTNANAVDIEIISRKPLIYRVWGTWTIPHRTSRVGTVALDFGRYPQMFKHVHQCTRITQPQRVVSPLGTWYLEGRALRVRVWSIGNIDTIRWNTDSTELVVTASQNSDKELNLKMRSVVPGWLNYITCNLQLGAFVTSRGPDTSRVGILAQAVVNKPMPDWLTRIAISLLLPRTMEDLDKEMERRYPIPRKRKWWFW